MHASKSSGEAVLNFMEYFEPFLADDKWQQSEDRVNRSALKMASSKEGQG
jgi:hypothetical protein